MCIIHVCIYILPFKWFQFDESHEIIARYDTLRHTREDLLDNDQESQEAIEKQRANIKKFTEDKNNEILACNNELAHLQSKLEETQGRAMKWCVYGFMKHVVLGG